MMKRNKIIKFIFEYENKVFSIFFTLFFLGVVWGTFAALNNDISSEYLSSSITQMFKSVAHTNILILFIVFLFGYTVIGFPFLCISVIFNGVCSGTFVTLILLSYGVKGVVISSVFLFPYFLCYVISSFYLTFSSTRLSVALYNVFKRGTRYVSPHTYSRPHIVKFAVFSAFIIIFSLIYKFSIIPILTKIL